MGRGTPDYERWQRLLEKQRREKENEERWASCPVNRFMDEIKQTTELIYYKYIGVDGGFLGFDRVVHPETKTKYQCLLRQVFVIPECRQNGIAEQLIRKTVEAADKAGCLILACCKPFEINYQIDNPDNEDIKTRTKGYAELLAENHFVDDWLFDLDQEEYGGKRKRMKQRFIDCGFVAYDFSDTMANPKKNGRWGVAYVPQSLDKETYEGVKDRIAKGKER